MSSHAASSLLPDGEPRDFPAVPRLLRCDYVAQLSLARIAVRYGELLEDEYIASFLRSRFSDSCPPFEIPPAYVEQTKHAWKRRPTLLSPDVPGADVAVEGSGTEEHVRYD